MRGTPLTIAQILDWADAYRKANGKWPTNSSGRIPGTKEFWDNLDMALSRGSRGLPGRSTLARLFEVHRGHRNKKGLPPLTEYQIVRWADAWKRRHRKYPKRDSGNIPEVRGETWARVNNALVVGLRGLPGDSSLARLLAEYRSVRNDKGLEPLQVDQILNWADSFYERTETWPGDRSGQVFENAEDTWLAVDMALRKGLRGLPGGSSITRLLVERRGLRNEKKLPLLTINSVWAWMVSHHVRPGAWPTRDSGPIPGTNGETWSGIATALHRGRRGFERGESLKKILIVKLAKRLQMPQE